MNTLLIQLSFLRPIRSLAVIAIYTALAGLWARHLFDLDAPTAWLVALNVALPLLGGLFFVGALQEPLHRPLSLTLPGIRRRQRRAAVITTLLVTAVATVGSGWWTATGVSAQASFGLAFALSTLPCLFQYRLAAGQAGGIAGFAGWVLVCQFAAPTLVTAMIELPWLFFIGGLAAGTTALLMGFSRQRTRERGDILFISPQTNFCSYLFHRGMVAGWQAERLARRNPPAQAVPGPGWKQTAVRTTGEWWAVLWHAQFGATMRGSFLRMHLHIVLVVIVGTLAMTWAAHSFSKDTGYWQFVAQCVAPDMDAFRPRDRVGAGVNLAIILPGMAAFYAVIQLAPPIHFPISRRRLAEIAYAHALRQCAIALILPFASLWLLSFLGQILSGEYRPALGLTAALGVLLPLGALLPWLLATGTVRRPIFRILAAIPVGAAMMIFAVAQPLQKMTLTPAGFGVAALTAVAGLALLRHRLYRDFATADLTQSSGLAQLIGLNLNR